MSGLELVAVGGVAILALCGLVWLGVSSLVRSGAGKASAEQRWRELEAQAKQRAKADEGRARPRPTEDEVDKWMDPE